MFQQQLYHELMNGALLDYMGDAITGTSKPEEKSLLDYLIESDPDFEPAVLPRPLNPPRCQKMVDELPLQHGNSGLSFKDLEATLRELKRHRRPMVDIDTERSFKCPRIIAPVQPILTIKAVT